MKTNLRAEEHNYHKNFANRECCIDEEYAHMGVKKIKGHYVDLKTGIVVSDKEVELRRTLFVNDS
jgi:hypothetical protein